MTDPKRVGVALAAAMLWAAAPAWAQDDDQPLYELRPGSVVVLVPETGVTYQIPVTVATEVCPDLDEAYLVSDFEGTTEVVCEVPQATAEAVGIEAAQLDGDDDGQNTAEADGVLDDDVGDGSSDDEAVTDGATDDGATDDALDDGALDEEADVADDGATGEVAPGDDASSDVAGDDAADDVGGDDGAAAGDDGAATGDDGDASDDDAGSDG